MSTATLERDLEQYLLNAGYEVTFRRTNSFDWFYIYVIYGGSILAEKRCRSYARAARWALGRIKDHQQGMRMLGGLVRQ